MGLEFFVRNGQYFVLISKARRGVSIGELALESDDRRRNQTVVCSTDCILVSLDRKGYKEVLDEQEDKIF
jgi:CRP-like cAMP-binding protein